MPRFLLFLLIVSGFLSCKTQKGNDIQKKLISNKVLSQSLKGLVVEELGTNKKYVNYNADVNFTPASTVKLFTLYTSLKTLGDSLTTLKYIENDTSIIFWGAGDPTFLHPDFEPSPALGFLKYHNKLNYFATGTFENDAYAPGWAWEDYEEEFQPENTAFPMYGNFVRFKIKDQKPYLNPSIFESTFQKATLPSKTVNRSLSRNQFFVSDSILKKQEYLQDIPFKTDINIIQNLLIDTLKANVNIYNWPLAKNAISVKGMATDTVYRKMMQHSDNFLAEQLLLQCSFKLFDTLSTQKMINYAKKKYLFDMPNQAKWIDGSGLSRYNLFTPNQMIYILKKLYTQASEKQLFNILANTTKSGTMANMFNDKNIKIYAKTGSMSGVYNICGYIKTQSGKILVFSFMNNNFNIPVSQVRTEVSKVLTEIAKKF